MATLPKSLLWRRVDGTGAEHAVLDDHRGLHARGVVVASAPLPHTCRYEVVTDESWSTVRLEVSTEGAGWLRTVRLERAAGRWRVTTAEQGHLDKALVALGRTPAGPPGTEDPEQLTDAADVDVSSSPLFNTLPFRRLGLARAGVGTEHPITAAWVLLPSLEVIASEQVYTARGPERMRFASDGFSAELSLDPDGYVIHYPGLADRQGAQTP
jgi:hypothetical protein